MMIVENLPSGRGVHSITSRQRRGTPDQSSHSMLARTRAAMRRHRIFVLIATLGCEHLVDPPLPTSATRFDAPATYTVWWNLTQACSGIRASLGAITWYVVPG